MKSIFSVGDFRFFWPENIGDFASFPSAWDSSLNTGIGQSRVGSLWITSYLNFSALFNKFGIPWDIIGLVFWILPSVLFSFFSAFLLFKYFFPDKRLFGLLAGFIYAVNSYFLMVLGGGQAGVALSYSLIPLTLLVFIRTINNPNLRNSILAGLILSLQIIFDPRIVYISGIAVVIYLIMNLAKLKSFKKVFFLLLPLLISVLINSFWIFPLVLAKNSPIPAGFNSPEGFRFFSFSDLSHAISLLHPNFPENIFGKVYFQRPEFLFLPILAFPSLFFINKNGYIATWLHGQKKKEAIQPFSHSAILFFALLGLIGVFLAKGASEPLGQINEFLFNYFPGMSMFRDPTKFYTLIALSYSILIPFSLFELSKRIKISNFKFQISNFLLLFTILYLLFLVRPLFSGQTQIFKSQNVPKDYALLKNFLASQPEFSRTLWIPSWQRFGFFSNNHPAIGREEMLKGNSKEQLKALRKFEMEQKLKDLGVKYIIIPYDSEEEIFLDDRKYDEKQYEKTVLAMQKIPWLSEVLGFGKIRVFEITGSRDRFWCNCDAKIEYKFVNPAEYLISIENAEKGDVLVFSEGYDEGWMLEALASKGETFRGRSSKFGNGLNGFALPNDGDYKLKIYYQPQKWVNIGLSISLIVLTALLVLLACNLAKKSKN